MQIRGRRLKFTAVLTMVVLALSGFSTGRHHSRHSGSGSGGGGCSSSRQDHDTSSSTSGGTSDGSSSGGSYDDSYDDSGSTGSSTGTTGSSSNGSGGSYTHRPTHRSSTPTSSSGSSGTPLKDGTVKLVSCATEKAPYATLEVSNPNARQGTFSVAVTFKDKDDLTIVDHYNEVKVPAKGKATVSVMVGGEGLSAEVDHCEVDPTATTSS